MKHKKCDSAKQISFLSDPCLYFLPGLLFKLRFQGVRNGFWEKYSVQVHDASDQGNPS